jgi:proteasome accessory factor B
MKQTRISRLVEIIGLLQTGRGQNTKTLAQHCGVSRRTIFRDLDVLRDAGVPLQFDDQQQIFRLPGQRFLPPTAFSPEETLALMVLCQDLGGRTGIPLAGAAHSAAVKLESSLPPRMRDYLREVAPSVRIQPPPSNPLHGSQPHFDALIQAIADRRAVRLTYGSLFEQDTIATKLAPYQLVFSRRSWYAIGRSSLHRSVRTFNVGRIARLEPLDERYQIPRGFSLDRYLGNAWHLIPEPGPDAHVIIRFQPKVAHNVAEVQWHNSQVLRWNSDGSLDFEVTVSGLGEITWWILGYGDQAEVIQPIQLRHRVAEHAVRLVERYGHSETNGHAPTESPMRPRRVAANGKPPVPKRSARRRA